MAAGVRVVDVERIVVDVPFTPRCQEWNAREVWQWRISEVIRVTTDVPDMVGYGETILHYTWGRVSDEAIAQSQGAQSGGISGRRLPGRGAANGAVRCRRQGAGRSGLPPVQSAARARMVSDLLVEHRHAAGSLRGGSAGGACARAIPRTRSRRGPGGTFTRRWRPISKVTPPHFRLDLDWNNMLLNAGNAAPVLAELDKQERVAIYELPIMQRDVEGHRQLRQKTTRPIALHFGDPPFPIVVRDEVCDGFVVGGGVASILRQATLAAAFEKPFWLQMVGTGLTTTMSLHLGAVLPFAQWPSVNCLNNYADDLLTTPLRSRAGYARVPDAPGLGIEIDEDALTRYRMEPPFEFPKPRLLLSVVWPGGRVVHYASLRQCWDDCWVGNNPVQERGVTMEVHADDGTKEWADLYNRVLHKSRA